MGPEGFAFTTRKSGSGRLHWLFLRRLGTSLKFRFKSLFLCNKSKNTSAWLAFSLLGPEGFEPSTKGL